MNALGLPRGWFVHHPIRSVECDCRPYVKASAAPHADAGCVKPTQLVDKDRFYNSLQGDFGGLSEPVSPEPVKQADSLPGSRWGDSPSLRWRSSIFREAYSATGSRP